MTLRCPYCRQTFEPQPGPLCPHCGKLMQIPRQLRPKPVAQAGEPTDTPLSRLLARRKQRTPHAGVPAWLAFTRSPRYITVLVAVFIALGVLLVQRTRRQEGPEGERLRLSEWFTGPVGRGPVTSPAQRASESLATLRTALELFRADCGRYPSTRENLAVLIRRPPGTPGWTGPYIKTLWPDPWKRAYRYALTNGAIRLSSDGPDGRADTADDIRAAPADGAPASAR